jgi:hypothetical protein
MVTAGLSRWNCRGRTENVQDGGTCGQEAADAGGEQAGGAWQLRIALAGPAYTGVAVLALCLLCCPPAPNMGTCAQSEVVFRRETGHVDPSEWSVGCVKTRDQLLPTFFAHF